MGLKNFKDFGKERGLYPLRIMQIVVLLMYLIKFPSFLFLPSLSELGNSTDRPWEKKQWATTWNQRRNWGIWSIRRKRFHHGLWKQNREKRDGEWTETMHRGLLLFKYTSNKGARHSTEKENKKAKYFKNILNSQKTIQSEL